MGCVVAGPIADGDRRMKGVWAEYLDATGKSIPKHVRKPVGYEVDWWFGRPDIQTYDPVYRDDLLVLVQRGEPCSK